MRGRKLFIVGLIIFSVFLSSFVFYAYQVIFTPNILVERTDKALLIYPEDTYEKILDKLYKGDYVDNMLAFGLVAKLLDYDDNIKPGYYMLKSNMTTLEAVRLLRSGQQTEINVTFNNIRVKNEIAARLAEDIIASEEEIDSLLNTPAVVEKYGFDTISIVSMFIPNTYKMYWTTTAEELLDRMYEEYNKFWNEERTQKAEAIGLTPKEVSVLASIVKAETSKADEMPRVAGVYLNRLNKNMRLEADPTLVFAVGDFNIKRILNEHKEIDSPFNTYRYRGLPPGPINMPSISAIDAVLNAEKHNYIFFCAKDDFSGYHNFAATYIEHVKNAQAYRKALNARKIYR